MEMQLLPKKNKRLITMEELEFPEEIAFVQILSRLPVKSLLRCKCICKHWRDWISSPQFKFLTQRRRILIFSRSHDYLDPTFSFPCIDKEDASVQSILEPWDGEYNPMLYNLLGSCNGFVLIGPGRTNLYGIRRLRPASKLGSASTREFTLLLQQNVCYVGTLL
ncbi:hypothetical protein LguiB_026216 [Lonicera macranthoides]